MTVEAILVTGITRHDGPALVLISMRDLWRPELYKY